MRLTRKKIIIIAISAVALIIYFFCLPSVLFKDPYSTVLEDRSGHLLNASIASDGQWRFPEQDSIPSKFAEAIVLFEDKRFWNHPGVDLISLGRAVRQNIKSGRVISGGSTLSMQVIRLSRKNRSRNVFNKVIEIILATRLEIRYSKQEILSLYAAHAPFGGNVVGIEAACWRYFGRDQKELSWSEAALLAVLPNNPSLIHLARNREVLKSKRDRLLKRLREAGKMDEVTCQLALTEPVPDQPFPLPRMASHLLDRAAREGYAQQKIQSTLDLPLQARVTQIISDHQHALKGNQIFNAAALVVEVKTGKVIAYVGNTESGSQHGERVDVIRAPRSTGSILKPFLFAAMLDDGKMLPRTLQQDVPTIINGFSPKNFTHEYDGAVPADKALIRSLNIPAVHELRTYRYERFYEVLKNIGLKTLTQPADHYGLSLVLGGAEGTLWDITGAYASMARTLNNYNTHPGKNRYDKSDFHSPMYTVIKPLEEPEAKLENASHLSAAAIWLTFEALKEVYRPGEESGWKYFNNTKKIAWKTGTSFGFRDGWAVGVNAEYAVGVWVGNADGEGRPGLTGTETAAPIMFDIFSQLPGNAWFQMPKEELSPITICSRSGHRATPLCNETEIMWVTRKGLETAPCPYHKKVHLSRDNKYQVNSDCESVDQMNSVGWFVLPPVQEYYFKPRNITYQPLPPYRKDCTNPTSLLAMDLIYPKPGSKIFIPRELDGSPGSAVFQVAHRNNSTTVYWHLDGKFIGFTRKSHQLGLIPGEGKHVLTLVDDSGETIERHFQIISRSQ
ncbi:MAG: penicillin-binding protein 1C [Azospira oryzae]|nr:MAG: penicillin-binding protein 1C [Azospira oryzae]